MPPMRSMVSQVGPGLGFHRRGSAPRRSTSRPAGRPRWRRRSRAPAPAACAGRWSPPPWSAAPAPRRASWCAASCVPPSTAASACSAVRTTLLYGCCAVSDTPAVWVWNRSCHERGFFAPKRSRIASAHSVRAARNLAISSKKSLCELKKNEIRGTNSSTSSPASTPYWTYSRPSRSVNASSCSRRGAGLADVVAAHRDRVPLRHFAGAEREDVGDQPHRRPRREDELLLRDELLQDVVLDGARDASSSRRPAARPPPGTSRRSSAPAS